MTIGKTHPSLESIKIEIDLSFYLYFQKSQQSLSTGLGFTIIDAIISDRKCRFVFGHFGRIIYLGHSIICTAFLQLKFHLNILALENSQVVSELQIKHKTLKWFSVFSGCHYTTKQLNLSGFH